MSGEKLTRLNTTDLGPESLLMRDWFQKRIKGQDRVVEDLVEAWALYRAGLKKSDKPIFKALLLGPSGVGKTLLSELLAEFLFHNRNGFTKIHCAELKQSHEVARLIGSPPGYIGYQDPNDPTRYDPESSSPALSQWNIDKHHFQYLVSGNKKRVDDLKQNLGRHAMEADQLAQDQQRLAELSKEVAKAAAKFNAAIKIIEDQIKNHPQLKEKFSQELQEKKEALDQLRRQYDVLKRLFNEKREAHKRNSALLRSEWEATKKGGLIYDYDNPSQYLSVVLFDEIEKAHEDLFNILLEVMDKGRLRLSNGKETSFHNSVIFMTGNVARTEIAEILSGRGIGFNKTQKDSTNPDVDDQIYSVTVEEASKTFPPEFIGRLDKILVFRPLSFDIMLSILDLHLQELHDDLLKANLPIVVEMEMEAKEFIVREAIERTEYGARMIEARVKKHIKNKLIRAFDNGSLRPSDVVVVKIEDSGKKKLAFYKKEKLKLTPDA